MNEKNRPQFTQALHLARFAYANPQQWQSLLSAEPTGWTREELLEHLQIIEDNELYAMMPVYLALKANNRHIHSALRQVLPQPPTLPEDEAHAQAAFEALKKALGEAE